MIIDPKFYGIAKTVVEDINGRAADAGDSLPKLGKIISIAGPGDHIEIGTLFGASAIMAALVKIDMGFAGQVYCIDQFGDRANIQINQDKFDPKLKAATLDQVLENFNKFGVADRMVILPQSSVPFPKDLEDHTFVTGYIDGDHSHSMPWFDFLSLRDRVRSFLMFDNFEEAYPDVIAAGVRAMTAGGWMLHYKEGIFMSLRRPFVVKDTEKDWGQLRQASMI